MEPDRRTSSAARKRPIEKRGGYQPTAEGPPPTVPPPKRGDSHSAATRPDAISGEPEFVSRQTLAEAADAFVAAMGSRNRMMLAQNLRYVTNGSDAMRALHEALARAYVPER